MLQFIHYEFLSLICQYIYAMTIEITLLVKMIIPFVSLIHLVNEAYSYFN